MEKTTIAAPTICKFLIDNYPEIFKNSQKITIFPLPQGYMNFVFRIEMEIPPLTPPTLGRGNIGNPHTSWGDNNFVGIIYNANRYQGEKVRKRLADCYKVARYLNENGIPCRVPIKNKNGEDLSIFKIEEKERFFGLYSFLNGETLPWEAYTRRHLRSHGMTMRKLHDLLENANMPNLRIPKWKDYLKNDFANLMNYFSKNSDAISRKLEIELKKNETWEIYERLRRQNLNQQIIHNDFVRGNILFSREKKPEIYPVTGILDFEKAMCAPKIADIARTLAFLLADCVYKTDEQIYEYFLNQGYGKIKLENINSYLLYYWLRDLWKFLSSNPYEDLKQNSHYNETVKRLKKGGILNKIAG